MMFRVCCVRRHTVAVVCLLLFARNQANAADFQEAVQAVKAVSRFAEGQAEAIAGLSALESAGAAELVPLLKAMNDANPLAVNWLRGAFESAADRLLKERQLPLQELEAFVNDRAHEPRVRRLAYEWVRKADPAIFERMQARMLDDPSPEMRRDAVASLIAQAEAQTNPMAPATAALWKQALSGAVDEDQFGKIAAALAKLEEPVNRVQHFGLLVNWHVIGPFDNRGMAGFDVVYPPEQSVNLAGTYEGLLGEVKWEQIQSNDEEGKFDLAKLTAPHKGAIDYLFTTFASDASRDVEFRLATPNAWKLWVNGELVFAREEYHRGMRFDQYAVRGHLQAGENQILLKLCQNEQEQEWAQDWVVQFRICDLTGRALAPAR